MHYFHFITSARLKESRELTRDLFIKPRRATRHEDVGLAKSLISDRESDRERPDRKRPKRGSQRSSGVSAMVNPQSGGGKRPAAKRERKRISFQSRERLVTREITLSPATAHAPSKHRFLFHASESWALARLLGF